MIHWEHVLPDGGRLVSASVPPTAEDARYNGIGPRHVAFVLDPDGTVTAVLECCVHVTSREARENLARVIQLKGNATRRAEQPGRWQYLGPVDRPRGPDEMELLNPHWWLGSLAAWLDTRPDLARPALAPHAAALLRVLHGGRA